MTEFCLRLAQENILVRTLYSYTHNLCAEFLVEPGSFETPSIEVETSEEDIDFEREMSVQLAMQENRAPRQFSDGYLESLAVYRKIATAFIEHDVMLFHGSAVQVDGKAYLFTAPSGTGKSTHTNLWKELLGTRMSYINDDKPLLKFEGGAVSVLGTPWNGKHRLGSNVSAPLSAIVLLARDESDWIEPVLPQDAIGALYAQSYRPDGAAKITRTLALVARLAQDASIYKLGCTPTQHAARLSIETLCGDILD